MPTIKHAIVAYTSWCETKCSGAPAFTNADADDVRGGREHDRMTEQQAVSEEVVSLLPTIQHEN
jgi:hypothetical protein